MPTKNAAKIAANDAEILANAIEFNVYLRNGNSEKISENFPTREEAEARAKEIEAAHPARRALISAVDAQGRRCPLNPAPARKKPTKAANKAKAAKKAPRKAAKGQPGGKRAAILAAAQAGKLPAPPDFSANTHARFRPRLEEIVALAKARDIKGLKAVKINPISSSPKALDKYRNLAVIALQAAKAASA